MAHFAALLHKITVCVTVVTQVLPTSAVFLLLGFVLQHVRKSVHPERFGSSIPNDQFLDHKISVASFVIVFKDSDTCPLLLPVIVGRGPEEPGEPRGGSGGLHANIQQHSSFFSTAVLPVPEGPILPHSHCLSDFSRS